METKNISDDVKSEVRKSLEKLRMLRDEVKLHLHLAELDAQKEWNEKLDPRITELHGKAEQLGEASKEKLQELLAKVESFYAKLRAKSSSPS